jgi:hypothetical protein
MVTSLDLERAKLALLRRAVAERPHSASHLFQLAEALAEAGENDAYADAFRRAYLLEPSKHPRLDRRPGESATDAASRLRDRARTLIAHGVIYSPVIAALAIGEALLGHDGETAALVDYDRFLRRRTLSPSTGMADFNTALAEEIRTNARYFETLKTSHSMSRFNTIMRAQLPASSSFVDLVREQVQAYIADLPEDDSHPFIASRPERYVLDGWAMVSGSASYHESHMHRRAWLTGVYYVVQPEISRTPHGNCGWLRLGPPAHLANAISGGWQERLLEPEAGTLTLMPGYFYHQTAPMHVDQERICISVDVVPADVDDEQSGGGHLSKATDR